MSRPPSKPEIIEIIKRLWAPIAWGIGAIVLIVEFIEIWKGNQNIVTWATVILSLIVLIVVLFILGFSPQHTDNKLITPTGYRSRQLRYLKYYKLARLGLLSIITFATIWGYFLTIRLQELERKTVVLIANFDGPDPQKYGFTEDLIAELQYEFQDYDEILIIPLDRTIREQQGSKSARREGYGRRADLVIWGGYSIPDTNTILTIHVEVMSRSELMPLKSSELSQMQVFDNNLQNSLLQQQFAGEMKDLVNFVTGLIYLESGNSEEALRWLQKISPQGGSLINSADTLFYKGTAYVKLEQYENAIKDFNESLKLDPNNPVTYYNLGISYLSIGHYEEAFISFDRAINLRPDYNLAYIGRGTCYTYSKEYIKAISDFDNSIKLDPLNADAFIGRGNALYFLNQYDQSINDLNQAVLLDLEKMEAYNTRALVYLSLNKYEQAIDDYNRAIELESLNPVNYAGRGNVYKIIEKYDLAISDYEKSISLDSNYAPAFYNLGILYVNLEEYNQAINNFNNAIQINPQMHEAYFNRGIVYHILEYFDLAIVDFQKVIELTDSANNITSINSEAKHQLSLIYFSLASSYANEEKYEEAIDNYNKAISFNPNMIPAYNNKCHIHILMGQTKEALLSLQKSVELLGFSNEEARIQAEVYVSQQYNQIGYSMGVNGQYEQAISFLNEAIAIDPKLTTAYINRGVIYGILERYDEAIFDLNRVIELNPSSADAYISRGAVYSRLEKYNEAITNLNMALEINPDLTVAYFNRGMVYQAMGKFDQAIDDFNKVLELIGDEENKIKEDTEKMLWELKK